MAHDVFRFAGNHLGRFSPRGISAGITLAALIIPLNIGYAQVAGLPSRVWPLCGYYSTRDIRPIHQLAPFGGKPGCPHFCDHGSNAYWFCSHRRPDDVCSMPWPLP